MEDQQDSQTPKQTPVPVMDIQPPRVAPEQQTDAVIQPPAEVPEASAEPQVPDQTDTPKESAPALAAVTPEHKAHHTPALAIACAVVVAGAFAAVAVWMYVSGSDTKQVNNQNQQSAASATGNDKATTADIDDTSKAIDEGLSGLDDAADYNDTSVSDTTLGL